MSDIDVTITPSNTIDVEFSGTAGLHTVSNVAYDATTWNGAEAIAPSKNAVRDKVETMDTAIGLNTAKDTNVSTSLSLGTINATTVSITSDGGADDVTLAEADTTNAGLLGSDKWDEIVANSLKATNATHTGDVTGATALTIGTAKVTLAMMANMATASLIYRKTAGAGVPQVNTLATLKTDLGLTGTNSGDNTVCTSGTATTAATLATARNIGGVSFNGSAAITVASATGGFTISGGALALTTNSITMSGSIGVTGTRVTKGWFTDLEVTNGIVGSITGNAATVTTNANLTGDITSVGNAATIGVDKVLVTHINWGVAATQVSAVDLVIADAGVIITATEVEGALQENRTAINLNTDKVTNATLFKTGDSSFTDDDTEQTFNDAFCTATSLVVVSITGATPAGIWSVVSAAGSFTITSSSAESTDITFDYYITKAV